MLPTIDLLRLLLDFGMLVLIWLVQLIIYPGFRYYRTEDLKSWHKRYMRSATVVIIPLMLGQLVVTCIQAYRNLDRFTLISLVVLFILWGQTFYQFVPLHNTIKTGKNTGKATLKLVKFNWWRTLLWNFLFMYSYITLAVSG